MIDIHNHSLFGVDDGADTLEETIAMTQAAYKQGVTDIFMTPHFRHGMFPYDKDLIEQNYLRAREEADRIGVNLYLGCEYHADSEMLDNYRSNRIHSAGDTAFILCEFSHSTPVNAIRSVIRDATSSGYLPIIAHAERYEVFQSDPGLAAEMQAIGAMIQCNADSVLGIDGKLLQKTTKKLLKKGLVDFIASDAHGIDERANHMADAEKFITRKYGEDTAYILFEDNPARIIDLI
ncbi:MAG: CpsB/CapC family capsule biosynthesis tyrosine phosphatase [Lachnospiraceae bacterium]|nr:CpsB/CapC family capsule biosynthesis tyrosine phosphatase [Lachnospiraceae bacterium]